MNIKFVVRPADGVAPAINSASIGVDATYSQTVPVVEGEPRDPIPQTVRLSLDTTMQGSTLLEDAATPDVQANVLAGDGSLIFSRMVKADSANNATLVLTQAEITLCADLRQNVPADTTPLVCTRAVRLIPISERKVDYTRLSAMVSPVKDEQGITASTVDTLLKIVGNKISSLDVTGQKLEPLTRIAWIPAHLAVDGTFTCAFTQQASIGWLWWLAGDQQVIGFVPDDLSKPSDRMLAIALPASSAPTPAAGGGTEKTCDCQTVVPQNATEAELANNPGIYTEDPGAFCKPFSNPERVLSEKSFSVIARVTQPEIGALGSTKTKGVRLLSLDGDERTSAGVSPTGGIIARLTNLFSPSRAVGLPTLALPTRHVLPIAYTDFVKSLPSGRGLMDAKHPLQWEDDIAQYQAATVSLGHILEFRIRWRSNGYSLGTVAKTLTLAPRQAKRIQKIEWERSERARRSERTQLTDVENDSVTRERDYQDHVSANLSEWARGSSHSDTAAIAGGIGFFVSGVLGGIGGGAGSSNSSSHTEGGRDTSASEHQRLRDAIRRHGDALRKFESTVVNEVTQEETVTGTTEVVRNLNYAHSLTVIYYQILRHLKVNTEFAGVRECLFIPFAIKAFDTQRAYRWREAIQAAIRSPRYLRALRYLKDVATNFSTSDIPPGTRAEQPLTYLRGSIFVDLAIERPKDTLEGKYDDLRWVGIKHLLPSPAIGIFAQLIARAEADRDRFFQANYAPAVATKWANRLRLRIAGTTVTVDSTLATRYQFNRGVRIDFVVPLERLAGLRRMDLQNVTVLPSDDLPPGSVANLTRMSFTYSTARFERSAQARTGVNDLISPETGNHASAAVFFPLDAWESVNERLEITRTVQDLVEHLNEHVEYYHKAIWWRMDRDRLLMMLDGFYVPNTNNVSVASVVDREPLGIIGNCLVYQVGAASFLGYGKVTTPAALYNLYAEKTPVRDPVLISLPTDGLYAQTIMDECLALEEHFGNLDWALSDKDPELGSLDPSLLTTRRTDPTAATTPTPLPATIINLQNAPDAPAPSGLQGVLNAVTNPNAFRDMAGLAATQANAQAALNTAASLATNFGNQAATIKLADMASRAQSTGNVPQQLAAVQKAKDQGLITDTTAADHASKILGQMHTPGGGSAKALTQEPDIQAAIQRASGTAGGEVNASRNTVDGREDVQLKFSGDDANRPFIIEPADKAAWARQRAFGPSATQPEITGVTVLKVTTRPIPQGGSVRWSVPPNQQGRFTLAGGQKVQSGLRADVTGIRPGISAIDFDVFDANGVSVESQKYPLCIPQFVVVNDSTLFDAVLAGFGLPSSIDKAAVLTEAKTTCNNLLSDGNVRTVWTMAPFNEVVPSHLGPNMVTTVDIRGNPPPGKLSLLGVTKDRNLQSILVGPSEFDEFIQMFPGAMVDPFATDIDQVAIQTVQAAVAAPPLTSNPANSFAVKVVGRVLGASMAHEIIHSLIGAAFPLPDRAHTTAVRDLLRNGGGFTFEHLTGIQITNAAALPAGGFTDLGPGHINRPQLNGSLPPLQAAFPVPPVFQ